MYSIHIIVYVRVGMFVRYARMCMYVVPTNVCMCVCVYVCMYVCMYMYKCSP